MQNLNHVVLIGRVTQDVGADERSFAYIGNGTAKANVSIAVNNTKKEGDKYVDDPSFFTVTVFGKTAENLKPYLKKGQLVCFEAHLKQDRWEKDGQKKSAISIIADRVELLGGKKEGSSSNSSSNNSAPSQGGFDPADGFPEDVPF
jgi:single-strand DNA-binding protein